jgi:hypothetical protein
MNAIVLLTHLFNDKVLQRFEHIECPAGYEKWILMDTTGKDSVDRPYVREFRLPNLMQAGYRPIAPTLVPGSNHFPVVEFAATSTYRHVWCVEYDVVFLGDWREFFDAHDTAADFESTCVGTPLEAPDWPWWSSLQGPGILAGQHLLRSFNPLYRLSAAAAKFLRRDLRDGWLGHHEVSMATLVHARGGVVEDLGGQGTFVRPDNRGRWYDRRTFAFAAFPAASVEGCTQQLVHPVKLGQESAIWAATSRSHEPR